MMNYSTIKSRKQKPLQPLWRNLSEQAQAICRGGLLTRGSDGEDYLIWTVVDEGIHS